MAKPKKCDLCFPSSSTWNAAITATRRNLTKLRVRDDLAEEVVSEAVLRALKAISEGKRVQPLGGWLTGASKLILLESNRKAALKARVLSEVLAATGGISRAGTSHLSHEALRVLLRALLTLTDAQIQAVILTVFHGWPVARAAREIGIRPQSMWGRRNAAVLELRRRLEREGHDFDTLTGMKPV